MITLRVVNKAFEGENEHPCFQNIDTNEYFEFSKVSGANINDKDITHPIIQNILNNGHFTQATLNEDGTLNLI